MTSPKGRILYVEDHRDTRQLVTLILKGQGYEVIPTKDGREALGVVRRVSFDLYIVDTWLPGISGLELCKRLRALDADIPILFFSGAVYESDKQRAFECGASGYLVKPLDTYALVSEVSRLLSSGRPSTKRQERRESGKPAVRGN